MLGGSAAAGRRTARLAGCSAGLGLFLYGTIAIAALGAGGPPEQTGWTASAIIGDRLSNNTVAYLWLLPLTTAALGWSAAAATARVLPALAAVAPLTVARPSGAAPRPVAVTQQTDGPGIPEPTVPGRSWSRTVRLLLPYAVVAAILILVAATCLRASQRDGGRGGSPLSRLPDPQAEAGKIPRHSMRSGRVVVLCSVLGAMTPITLHDHDPGPLEEPVGVPSVTRAPGGSGGCGPACDCLGWSPGTPR